MCRMEKSASETLLALQTKVKECKKIGDFCLLPMITMTLKDNHFDAVEAGPD